MTLTVTQNTTQNNLTITQSNVVVKLQPVINASAQIVETDPIFQASEASLFVAGDKANLDNQSGINSGDETTSSIQTKRPLKTVNSESLEGNGNVQIDYNDLDNLPTIITNHSGLNLDDGTNPHGTTKNDVGLGNVNNTSDIDKPISSATQTALNSKQDLLNAINLGQIIYDELDIKSTPSADDEIVMYDSITGEAVTAKFSSFGGSSDIIILGKITDFTVTGTTSQTLSIPILIPENTIQVGSRLVIEGEITSPTKSNHAIIRLATCPLSDFSGGVHQLSTATYTAANKYLKQRRAFHFKEIATVKSIKGYRYSTSSITDDTMNTFDMTVYDFDWTIDNYIAVTIQLGNIADSVTVESMIFILYK